MTSKNELATGITAIFGDSRTAPRTAEGEEGLHEGPVQRTPPRTILTGRRRKDDPRPLRTADDERTSLVLNKHQYAKVRAIALQESMTIKDLVHEMFKLGIDRYEKKHGPVQIGEPTGHKDIF